MSTSFGSGVGGSMGGPPQPTQREIETSAWTLVNKSAMGIVADSLDIPFTQLGGQLWKYQSDPNRPNLGSLGTIRTSLGSEEESDSSWKSQFDDLVDKLPEGVRKEFVKDRLRPFAGRSPNFAQLENTLTVAAKALTWLEGAQKPLEPQSQAMDRLNINRAMPGKALRGTIKNSTAILQRANSFLEQEDANPMHRDSLRYFSQKATEMQESLNSLLEVLQDSESPPPTSEELKSLSDQAQNLLTEFQRVNRGTDLQIMGPMMESMAAIAAALSLTPASPTLFLGLKLATMGLYSSSSATGLFGSELAKIIKALQSGQGAALLQKMGQAKLQMLLMSLLGTLGGAGTLAALLSEFGIGRFPARNEGDQKLSHRFGLELIMSLLASSAIIKNIYSVIAEICGANSQSQEIFSSNMELVSLLLMSLTAHTGSSDDSENFLDKLKEYLVPKFIRCRNFMEDLLRSEDNFDKEQLRGLNIALSQATLAAEKDQGRGSIKALANALKQISSTPEQLNEELTHFAQVASLFKQCFSADSARENAQTTALLRSV